MVCRDTEQPQERETSLKKNQGFNFLEGSFSNRDNVRAPIQFRRECHPQHLKRWYFLKNRPLYFHIHSTSVIRQANRNQLSLPGIESNFQLQFTVFGRSDSSSEANPSCCHRSDAWSHLTGVISVICKDSNISDNLIKMVINV